MATAETGNVKEKTSSTDVFADGIIQLLRPIVVDCDSKIQAVFVSQNELSDQIDQLAAGK